MLQTHSNALTPEKSTGTLDGPAWRMTATEHAALATHVEVLRQAKRDLEDAWAEATDAIDKALEQLNDATFTYNAALWDAEHVVNTVCDRLAEYDADSQAETDAVAALRDDLNKVTFIEMDLFEVVLDDIPDDPCAELETLLNPVKEDADTVAED